MNKIIKSISSPLWILLGFPSCFIIGFFLCVLLFVGAGEGNSDWGDCATWVGSCVAFLAFVAACYAAIWSKKSSDQSIEKNTILSLYSIFTAITSNINEEFSKIISESDVCKKHSKQRSLEYFIDGFSASYSHIFSMIESSLESEENKNLLKKGFFASLSYCLINEIIIGSPTAVLRTGDAATVLFGKTYRQLYSPMNVEIRRLGMYKTLTESADRNCQ